ncbi:Pectinesterase inhibitor [Artemisia annua]|uniref:Pectinesterase inhibitor n=1 Tax=Artemisia annua TaxID=35608 RepID=A0A2U1M3M8_ARTAN|nr:Pectinesterase inhibitor [Artemisia annua]
MEFKNQNPLRLLISIVYLVFVSSVKGSNLSPSSSSQENERRVDEVKKALGPLLDEAKEEFGPISSWDFEEVQEAFGPISDGAREAFGPISSLDLEKVEEAFGPISDETKEAFGPVSSSMLHEAKEALGPISPSTLEEAKEAFTEKAQEQFDSIASLITQNKEATSSESSEAPTPISPSTYEKAKEEFSTISSEVKHKFDSITSFMTQNKEETSSKSSSISNESEQNLSPMSSYDLDSETPVLTPASSPSSFYKAVDEAKHRLGSISSLFTQKKDVKSTNKAEATPLIYIDHDVSLAIESLIKQALSDLQQAIEQAKKISVAIPIATPDTEISICLNSCIDNYETCEHNLLQGREDLKARNSESLKKHLSEIEGEINECRKCYSEHTDDKSPLGGVEEATIKAARDCLNVLNQHTRPSH